MYTAKLVRDRLLSEGTNSQGKIGKRVPFHSQIQNPTRVNSPQKRGASTGGETQGNNTPA